MPEHRIRTEYAVITREQEIAPEILRYFKRTISPPSLSQSVNRSIRILRRPTLGSYDIGEGIGVNDSASRWIQLRVGVCCRVGICRQPRGCAKWVCLVICIVVEVVFRGENSTGLTGFTGSLWGAGDVKMGLFRKFVGIQARGLGGLATGAGVPTA